MRMHMCYSPLKVSSEIALRKLNEQKDIFTIWENFVPELFIQTAVSRERNEISLFRESDLDPLFHPFPASF